MSKRIINPAYRQFLDEGVIDIVTIEQIQQAANSIKGKYVEQARALLYALYYTGARPVEVLDIRAKDVTKNGQYIVVQVRGAKNGLPRKIFIKSTKPGAKELYAYAAKNHLDMLIFFKYRGNYKRYYKKKNGEIVKYIETSYKLRYHFALWFRGILDLTPYFLRHSRFSSLAESGASDRDMQQMKGSKTVASIQPYVHMSTKTAKSLARIIN